MKGQITSVMIGLLQWYKTIWVKVFRIIPEFRILRLTFHRKSASKCWIQQIIYRSPELYLVFLKPTDHLSIKLWIFSRNIASFKIRVLKVQDFENFELSPMKPHVNQWKVTALIRPKLTVANFQHYSIRHCVTLTNEFELYTKRKFKFLSYLVKWKKM